MDWIDEYGAKTAINDGLIIAFVLYGTDFSYERHETAFNHIDLSCVFRFTDNRRLYVRSGNPTDNLSLR